MTEPVAPQRVITCILPKGQARPLVDILVREHGITQVDVHYARGVGRLTPLRYRGIGETKERDILTVAVPAEQADATFFLIHELAEINHPHGGLMYMHLLQRATPFELPEFPEEN